MATDEQVRAFFADNSNPVEAFTQPDLSRVGILDLRDRILTHVRSDILSPLVHEVYTDELLALIAEEIEQY